MRPEELSLDAAVARFRWQRAGLFVSEALTSLGGVEALEGAPIAALRDQVPPRVSRRLALETDDDVRVRVAVAQKIGYRALAGERFPPFVGLPDPPLAVLVKGELHEGDALAIVGARQCSSYGRRMARRLARSVAQAGVSVVSGLARGIDGEAHRGALDVEGHTVAVLGFGPDRAYPAEHDELLRTVEERGVVITEHLPGVPPRPYHFPQRNRLLVAVSRALLVVESTIKSGTLTSVRWAADLGRDVLVVPGPVDSPLGEGPLLLLREGATPVGEGAHVLEALGINVVARSSAAVAAVRVTADEERLLALISGEALPLDELVRLSGESPGRVLTLLLGLEARRIVARDHAMAYHLVRSDD